MMRTGMLLTLLLTITLCGCSRSDSLPNQADSAQQTTVSQPEVSQNKDASAVQQNTENLMRLPEIYASLHNQTEAVKQKHYPNLTFSDDFSVHMPDSLHEVCRLRLTNKPEIPREECFALFDRLFDDAFSDYYGENDKKEQYRIWSNDLERDPTQKPPFDLPAYYDHETDFLSQKISVLQLVADTPHGYLAVEPNGRVHALNRGNAYRMGNKTGGLVGLYSPTDDHEIIADYRDPEETIADKYRLLDGELSVTDAAKQAAQIIYENNYGGGTELRPVVSQVKVVQLAQNQYAYSFSLTPEYRGVMFDVFHTVRDNILRFNQTPVKRDYRVLPGSAVMTESGKLDSFVSYYSCYDVTADHTYDSILSFQAAADKVSDAFSRQMKLCVSRADLRYVWYNTDRNTGETAADPVWKFTAENANDQNLYSIYIDAISGECDYRTQPPES